MKNHYSTSELSEGIKSSNNDVLVYIYENIKPKIVRNLKKIGASLDEADEVFQIVLSKVFYKLKTSDSVVNNLESYLGISCRNEFFKVSRSKNYEIQIDEDNTLIAEENDENKYSDDELSIILRCYAQLKEDCKKIIKLRGENVAYKEIAKLMMFKSEQYAKVKMKRCREYFLKKYKELENDR